MCGIAGFVTRASSGRQREALARALERLHHRGPDDGGTTILPDQPADGTPSTGLGNRRLAILDLSPAGHQPMATADGRFTMVYNGELYNYRELRRELEGMGRRFRSESDTEVVLQAFAEWGVAMLPRLAGMFALAIHDRLASRVLLARDPFGIKPLYYSLRRDTLVFASEIPALIEFPGVSRDVDARHYYDFLAAGNTDYGGGTLFADVRQLPAGHTLEVPLENPGGGTPTPYWDLDLRQERDCSFDEAAELVRASFLECMKLHLRSDVPLGFALSGGIDSSAVVGCARHLLGPAAALHTFSFIPDDPTIDEREHVDAVVAATGATAHILRLSADDLRRDIDRLSEIQAEPFASPVIYAQYRVFGLARDHGMKVVLGGQGADEMLAGYDRYLPARIASLFRQGRWRKALAQARHSVTPYSGGATGAMRIAAGYALPAPWYVAARLRWRGLRGKEAWLDSRWFAERGVAPVPPWAPTGHRVLREMLAHNLRESQIQALMRYEDRNAMAFSIENRVPFLSPAFAQLLFSLPEEYLLAGDGTRKAVFRRAMRGIVPDQVLDRRDKIGFSVPMRSWFAALKPWIAERLAHVGGLPGIAGAEIATRWSAGTDPYLVWRCVSLSTWAERFGARFT